MRTLERFPPTLAFHCKLGSILARHACLRHTSPGRHCLRKTCVRRHERENLPKCPFACLLVSRFQLHSKLAHESHCTKAYFPPESRDTLRMTRSIQKPELPTLMALRIRKFSFAHRCIAVAGPLWIAVLGSIQRFALKSGRFLCRDRLLVCSTTGVCCRNFRSH